MSKNWMIVFVMWWAMVPLVSQIATDSWTTHFAYSHFKQVEMANKKVFVLANHSLFSYDPASQSVEKYSILSHLSDHAIDHIRYYDQKRVLVVVYANSNIDLITDKGTRNLPDVYLKNIAGSKKINDISFAGDYLYLSADCGVIVVNLNKYEVVDTYDLNLPIVSSLAVGNTLYAFTAHGVWSGEMTKNLLDRNNWRQRSPMVLNKAIVFKGEIVAEIAGEGLYKWDADKDEWILFARHKNVRSLKSYSDRFVAVTDDGVWFYSSIGSSPIKIEVSWMNDVSVSPSGKEIWTIVPDEGLFGYQLNGENKVARILAQKVRPESPLTNAIYNGLFDGKRMVFTTSGPYYTSWGQRAQIMRYDGRWDNISNKMVKESLGFEFIDMLSIATDPADPSHFFVSTWYHGLVEFVGDTFVKRYTDQNSSLRNMCDNNGCFTWVDGLSYDKSGNLWMLNTGVERPLNVLKHDKSWKSFSLSSLTGVQSLNKLLILRKASNEYKWIISGRNNPGLAIFDDGGTIENEADDRSLFFGTLTDQEGNNIPSSAFNCMVEDHRGSVWMGTGKGPVVFDSPERAFEGSFYCKRILVPRNDGSNYADYLLEEENITTIAVDGANRKWLGTSANGLFLVSEDGKQIIEHIHSENSPLPGNHILSISIHPRSGEVFVSTELGLVSFRGDASEPAEELTEVFAYPNPVRPDYSGWITIGGLVDNTEVKIVNSGGQLVWSGRSEGGQVIWKGFDDSGRRVRTGVYMVFCSTSGGAQRAATKILIVN